MAGELREPLLAGAHAEDDAPQHGDRSDAPPRQPIAAAAVAASEPPPAVESLAPLGSPSPLSSLTFAWVSPLLRRGSEQGQLHQRDLFALPPWLHPAACGRRLLGTWRQERDCAAKHGGDPSLLRAIAAAYGRQYLLLGLLKLAGDSLNFAGPLLLNLIMRHLAAKPGGAVTLRLLGWRLPLAAPAFGYACAAALAGSLLLKVGWACGGTAA